MSSNAHSVSYASRDPTATVAAVVVVAQPVAGAAECARTRRLHWSYKKHSFTADGSGSTPRSSIEVTRPIASQMYVSCWNHVDTALAPTFQPALNSANAPVAASYTYARRNAGTVLPVERVNITVDRRRISTSISKRRLSRRSCTTSDCSLVVSPSLMPSSMSAWRTQRVTDYSEIPKSTATSARVNSPRRATVTTSRLNSSGNCLGMTSILPQGNAQQTRCQPNLRQTQTLDPTRHRLTRSDDRRGDHPDATSEANPSSPERHPSVVSGSKSSNDAPSEERQERKRG